MAQATGLKEYVVEAKQWHVRGLERLRELHDDNAPGRRVVSGISDLLDSILLLLYRNILENISEADDSINSRVALVLHGGCGRREVAPYSDVDFMLLYRGETATGVEELARQLSQDICDTGFQVGFSIRSPREACSMAVQDASIFSSLTESRFIGGSIDLYENYLARLKRLAQRRATYLIRSLVAAREEERRQFGETVYLLRPNVKKSPGGLRDIHLVRWIGFVRFGETDIDQLCRKGALTSLDAARLNSASEYLLRLRNELHFAAGRSNDMLGKNEQVRIAEKFGYEGSDVFLPVESMMRDYFSHTCEVRYCSGHFSVASQSRRTIANVFAPLTTRPVENVFRMGPFHVGVQPSELDNVQTNLDLVLRLMQLSIIHSREIDPETWHAIRGAMTESTDIEMSPEVGAQFMALLSNPNRLGSMLRRLAEMRVLEKIIPPFEHARSLLQFNEYHKYTVDEHSILAVEQATEFQGDSGLRGRIYRSIQDKSVLHLALLIHDLGKGYLEDHCEVGRRLSEEICERLQVGQDTMEEIKFLVHNHLMMSHVAFQRNINDEHMVAEFASNVGSARMLQLLYLLTCADIAAVGPDALNQWKLGLLTDLYRKACDLLTGQSTRDEDKTIEVDTLNEFRTVAEDDQTMHWLLHQARRLPENYYRNHPKEQIARQLLEIREIRGLDAKCWVSYDPDTRMMELSIGREVRRRSGIFYRITGMLASKGLRIRTADIKHLENPLVWYWFQFEDPSLSEAPTEKQLEDIRAEALQLAQGKEQQPPKFPKNWLHDPKRSANLPKPPIRVQIDNHTVEWATVVDVFAYYRLGLLYEVSKRIYELELDVRFARIASFGNQVIDVFYVTDDQGQKLQDKRRLARLRSNLLKTTKDFLEGDAEPAEEEAETNSDAQPT